MKVFLASDHAGLEAKNTVFGYLADREGYEVTDFGPFTYEEADDYPDYIRFAAREVARNPEAKAIIFGGSGQGEAMLANRFAGVRAAVFYGGKDEIIDLSREHNNANVLSIGARFVDESKLGGYVESWLHKEFPGEERHTRRLKKIEQVARMGVKSPRIEFLGWVGVVLIVGAYASTVFGFLDVKSLIYLFSNVVASTLLGIDAHQDQNAQAVVVNIIWVVIGLVGVVQFFL